MFTQNNKLPEHLDVDEFVSPSEPIWINLALQLLLTNGPSAVNGCRQSWNSWKRHHTDPQVIHMTPVQQLTSCEEKNS